jgi:uncharacterized protein
MRMTLRFLICLALGFGVLFVDPPALRAETAPSFDCSQASAAVEKSICANASLAGADADLAALFAKVRDRFEAKRRASLLAGQRAWLRLREVACPPGQIAAAEFEACIQRLYDRRLLELNRQAALQDQEAAEPKAPRADIDAILDAKRELAAYGPDDMSAMHLIVNDQTVSNRLPQSCRELNALFYGNVWQYGMDTTGMSSQAVAQATCEYATQEVLKWPTPASSDSDVRFDDLTKYSWEWAKTVDSDYDGKGIASFAKKEAAGKIKIATIPVKSPELCAADEPDRETLSIDAGKADYFCFGGWIFYINKRAFGDFLHRGDEQALLMMTAAPSGPVGTVRVHGLWIAYYDPATDCIRPEPVHGFFEYDGHSPPAAVQP